MNLVASVLYFVGFLEFALVNTLVVPKAPPHTRGILRLASALGSLLIVGVGIGVHLGIVSLGN